MLFPLCVFACSGERDALWCSCKIDVNSWCPEKNQRNGIQENVVRHAHASLMYTCALRCSNDSLSTVVIYCVLDYQSSHLQARPFLQNIRVKTVFLSNFDRSVMVTLNIGVDVGSIIFDVIFNVNIIWWPLL